MRCPTCGTVYEGVSCPECGGTATRPGLPRRRRRHIVRRLWDFLWTLIGIAVVTALLLFALDLTAYAHDPANALAYGLISRIRSWFTPDALAVYDGFKAELVRMWINLVSILKNGV